jgi:hypothetical protein
MTVLPWNSSTLLKCIVYLQWMEPGADVLKNFTCNYHSVMKPVSTVIYSQFMEIPSFSVTKLYYLGNYHGMTVNYIGVIFNTGTRQYPRSS